MAPTINDIREITPIIDQKLNLDLYNYALSFLRRRFAYVFNALNIKSVQSFVDGIKNGSLIEDFCFYFPVPDTEMFRDPAFWRALNNKILANISGSYNVWIPELVSAEELLSLLVILKEKERLEDTKIFCNILSKRQEISILEGECDDKHLEISKQNFKRLEINSQFEDYFTCKNKSIVIKKELMKNIIPIKRNMFLEGPTEKIDFCLYRNRMIYFNYKLQEKAESEILKYLNKDGLLAIGIKERISEKHSSLFGVLDGNEKIFKV